VAGDELRARRHHLVLEHRVVGHPAQELLVHQPRLEAGDVLAEAHVGAVTEGERARRAAVDVEAIGIRKLALVAVRGAVEKHHAPAGAQPLAAQHEVLGDGPRQEVRRHLGAEDLREGLGQQARVGDELGALLGMAMQLQDAPGEDLRQRLRSAGHEGHQVHRHLLVAEAAALQLEVEVDLHRIVRPDTPLAPLPDHLPQVVAQLERGRDAIGRHAREAGLAREETPHDLHEEGAIRDR
jgi:hypothetical protein